MLEAEWGHDWAWCDAYPGNVGERMPDIAFTTRLAEADWDDTMRGWRCSALNIPGAIVDDLYVDGERVDKAKYEILTQHSIIRWIPASQPQRVAVFIKLTRQLSLEAETEKWKKLAIILPVIATIAAAAISGAATYLSKASSWPNAELATSPSTTPGIASASPSGQESRAVDARATDLPNRFLITNEVGGKWSLKFNVTGKYRIDGETLIGLIDKLSVQSDHQENILRVSLGACYEKNSSWDFFPNIGKEKRGPNPSAFVDCE